MPRSRSCNATYFRAHLKTASGSKSGADLRMAQSSYGKKSGYITESLSPVGIGKLTMHQWEPRHSIQAARLQRLVLEHGHMCPTQKLRANRQQSAMSMSIKLKCSKIRRLECGPSPETPLHLRTNRLHMPCLLLVAELALLMAASGDAPGC